MVDAGGGIKEELQKKTRGAPLPYLNYGKINSSHKQAKSFSPKKKRTAKAVRFLLGLQRR